MTRKRDYRPPSSMSRNVARAVHAVAWEKDLKTRAKKKAANYRHIGGLNDDG